MHGLEKWVEKEKKGIEQMIGEGWIQKMSETLKKEGKDGKEKMLILGVMKRMLKKNVGRKEIEEIMETIMEVEEEAEKKREGEDDGDEETIEIWEEVSELAGGIIKMLRRGKAESSTYKGMVESLKKKDEEMKKKDEVIKQKDDVIQKSEATIKKNEKDLKDKSAQIQKNEQEMKKKDDELKRKDDVIEAMEKAKKAAEEELNKRKEQATKGGTYTSFSSINHRYSSSRPTISGNNFKCSGHHAMTFGDVMTSVC